MNFKPIKLLNVFFIACEKYLGIVKTNPLSRGALPKSIRLEGDPQ